MTFFRRPVWLVVLFCLGCSAQSLSPELNQRIERQVRAHFKLPTGVVVNVGGLKPSEFSGYDTLPITFEGGGQKNTYDFLLSKDGKNLVRLSKIDISPEAYARTLVQDAENRRAQAELMKKINVSGRPWRGSNSPKLSIIVYDDFQCPYCATLYKSLFADEMKTYNDRVRIIFKDFPLDEIHPWAKRAAIDSNCLAEQSNDAYWSFSDYVHENQRAISGPGNDVNGALSRLDIVAIESGKKFNVDANTLQACLKSQPDAALKASMKEADALGVSSTPTMFINGDKVDGALSVPELRKAFDAALLDASAPAVAATAPAPPAVAMPRK